MECHMKVLDFPKDITNLMKGNFLCNLNHTKTVI